MLLIKYNCSHAGYFYKSKLNYQMIFSCAVAELQTANRRIKNTGQSGTGVHFKGERTLDDGQA